MILIGPVLTVMVCVFAILRGGAAERLAALLALVVLAGSIMAQAVVGRANAWPVVGADLCLGTGLTALAVRYQRRWLYVATGLCAGLLLVHSVLLEDGATITPLYRGAVDSFNAALLFTLAVATLVNTRKR